MSCSLPTPRAASYLVIRLAGREFALEAGAVQGMVQARGLHLPASASSVLLHGFSVPLLRPHPALQLRSTPISARSCLLLIGSPGRPPKFALLADSVSRIERIPAHCTRLEPTSPFALAQIRLGEKWRDVLDLDRLAHPHLSHPANSDLSV